MTTENDAKGPTTPNPTPPWDEDKALKELMSFPRVVADFIEEFLPDLASITDADSIEPIPTVTIAVDGRERRSDYACAAKVRGNGRDRWVALLIENQSSQDSAMLDRLISYARGLRNTLANHPRLRTEDGTTPPIVPVVFFTGARRWTAPRSTRGECYSVSPEVDQHQLAFSYKPVESRRFSEYDGGVPGVCRAVAVIRHAPHKMAMKAYHSATRKLLQEGGKAVGVAVGVQRWLTVVARKRWPAWDGTRRLEAAAGAWVDISEQTEEANLEEVSMGYATWQWEFDAIEARGRAEGLKQGMEKGRLEGKTEALRQLVTWKFGVDAWPAVTAWLGPIPAQTLVDDAMREVVQCDTAASFLRRIQRQGDSD